MKSALVLLLAIACHKAPDPLADFRKTCEELQTQKALRTGLTVEQCAQELKTNADLNDPGKRAEELADRLVRLTIDGHGKPAVPEVKDTQEALARLGRPAVAPALSRLQTSGDPEARLALGKVLVFLCADDCTSGKFDCIVPALLEGLGEDKPVEVRREAEKGLVRCTGEPIGDDPAAWKKWWQGKQAAASASR